MRDDAWHKRSQCASGAQRGEGDTNGRWEGGSRLNDTGLRTWMEIYLLC